jgi:ABC-type branched-subunit amino acid transport system substrate-binding protein
MRRWAFLFLACALAASCADPFEDRYQPPKNYGYAYAPVPAPLPRSQSTARMSGRVAILLPLSGARADLGQTLLQAAQLGFDGDIDVHDTGGTPDGAATAARAALAAGDVLLLGPLTSAETAAVTPVAKADNVPVLAFTNDAAQAQPGVWTLGISPDQQIRRLAVALQAAGKNQVAALLPDTDYGRAMQAALQNALRELGLPAPLTYLHEPGMAAITSTVRTLSDYANRRGPIDARIRALRSAGTSDARHEAAEVAKTPIPPPPFDVLLLADTGDELQEIAAVLPYYDIDRSAVQVIGPALWAARASGSAAMPGAWYAAPDTSARASFTALYEERYGHAAPAIADLAFDAGQIARAVISRGGDLTYALTQSYGFRGSDGWITLQPTGQVHRGLAVFRIERSGSVLIEGAPDPTSPGF